MGLGQGLGSDSMTHEEISAEEALVCGLPPARAKAQQFGE